MKHLRSPGSVGSASRFLEVDGRINWLGGDVGGIGTFRPALVQNPSEQLRDDIDGRENLDVE